MASDTITAAVIQGWLEKAGPAVPLQNRPLFRLVWADDQRELRLGTYNVYSNEGIFLRTERKVERVPKYDWLKEKWVLEQWVPPELVMTEELPESVYGSYEPRYVFADHNGNALPLNLAVVQFIVQQSLKPKTSEMLKKSILTSNLDAKFEANKQRDFDMLNDEGPLVSQFHDKTAILRP